MENCIFCKIAKGEIPSEKLWEDKSFFSFLDIHLTTEGMALVIPKLHLKSDVFANKDIDIHELMSAAKEVSALLKKNLPIERVSAVFEGIEVDHLHIKLYPLRTGESLKMVLNNSNYNPTPEDLHKLCMEITK
jgi:histidine triad (HIT) family protein